MNYFVQNILIFLIIAIVYASSHLFIHSIHIKILLSFMSIFILLYLILKALDKHSILDNLINIPKTIFDFLSTNAISNLTPLFGFLLNILSWVVNNKIYIGLLLLLSFSVYLLDSYFFRFNNIFSQKSANLETDNFFYDIVNYFIDHLKENSTLSFLSNIFLLFFITSIIVGISYITATKFFKDQNNNLFVNMLKLSVIGEFFFKNNKLSFGSYHALMFSFIFSIMIVIISIISYVSFLTTDDNLDDLSVGDEVIIKNSQDNNIYIISNMNENKTEAILVDSNDKESNTITQPTRNIQRTQSSFLTKAFQFIFTLMPILTTSMLIFFIVTKIDYSDIRTFRMFKTLVSSIFTLLPCLFYSFISSYNTPAGDISFSRTLLIIYVIEIIVMIALYLLFIDSSAISITDYIDVLKNNDRPSKVYLDKPNENHIQIDKLLTDKNHNLLSNKELKNKLTNKKTILSKSCKYSLSFWFNLNPQNSNLDELGPRNIVTLEEVKKDSPINILHNGIDNTIIVKTSEDNLIIPYVPYQKWNYFVINSNGSNLDIFMNSNYLGKVNWNCSDKKNKLINQALNARDKTFNLLKTLVIGDKYTVGSITRIYYHRDTLSNYDILKNYNTTTLSN